MNSFKELTHLGKITIKLALLGVASSMVIEPLSVLPAAAVIASPKPSPPVFRFRLLSTRANGTNTSAV